MSYDFDHYSGAHLKAPVKPKKPVLGHNPTAIEARAYADALEEYERNMKSYKEDMSYHNHQKEELFNKFKTDVMFDYDLKELQFDLIWEYTPSTSLQETYCEFRRLHEFGEAYKRLVESTS